MAFNKRTWKGRQGVGLNKFSINGASPVTVVNQPDSITEVGDALSAGNLNDLEDRIADAFDETASQEEVTDLKNALTAVDHRVQNLESAKGDYVPVDSTKGVITTPSGKGKWAVVEKLRGVTRGVNQQIPTTAIATASSNQVTCTNNGDGTYTLNGTATGGNVAFVSTFTYTFEANKKYLLTGCPSGGDDSTYFLLVWDNGANIDNRADYGNGTIVSKKAGGNPSISLNIAIYIREGTNVTGKVFRPNLKVLNQYFGTSDLSFLGATDSAKLATIQTYYPWLLEPSEYGSSLVSTEYEGVKSVGVNIWDEEWEIGNYGSSGEKISGSSLISKNMIPVKPSTAYYFYEGFSPAYHNVYYYDANGTYISKNTTDVTAFTTPSNCYFMNFALAVGYGTSYRNDITIAEGSTAVTYHPHMESTLSLPTPITLKSAGSVAEEFDLETGEKTNPLGSVDLGTLYWEYSATNTYFYAYSSDMKVVASSGVMPNFTCAEYNIVVATGSSGWANVANMSIGTRQTTNYICIKNTSKTGSDLVSGHASWLEGVILNYELATPSAPTQLTPIQNPTILTESGGTISAQTEEPIDGNFSVGFITL